MKRTARILLLAVALLALGAAVALRRPRRRHLGLRRRRRGRRRRLLGGGGSAAAALGRRRRSAGGGVAFLIFIGVVLRLLPLLGGRRRSRRAPHAQAPRAPASGAVELAAAEAADDDAAFAADEVRGEAAALLNLIVEAWTARDRDALRRMLGPDLMVEWERRLDDFDRKGWHNVCEILGPRRSSTSGLVNRADDADDRVTVRVESRQRDFVDRPRRQHDHAHRPARDRHGRRVLDARQARRPLGRCSRSSRTPRARTTSTPTIVASPWGDDGACATRPSPSSRPPTRCPTRRSRSVADLDFDGTARAAALDLAMVDGRFAPDVLEAAARQAVAAWAEAVDGDDAALERAATPGAVRELLYAGDASERTRLVVRGPRLRRCASPRCTPTRRRPR